MPSIKVKSAAVAAASLAAVLSAGVGSLAAHATTVSYPNFDDTAGLTFVGSATTTTTQDGTVLRLTPSDYFQTGAAYSTTPIELGTGDTFSTNFQFRLSNAAGLDPADGITLVLAASPQEIGVSGGGLGYEGVPNSIAVEYDTFNDGSDNGPGGNPDPNDNHVAIDEDGALTNLDAATPYGVAPCNFSQASGCLSDGDLWTTNIGYNGVDLTVSVQDGSMPAETLINAPIDVAGLLGTDIAYVGLTGSTGDGFEDQDIKDFAYSNTLALASASPSPEPSTWTLLALALAGVGLMLRRAGRATCGRAALPV